MKFLTAEWRKLCLVTWKVPDEVLSEYLHPGLELDRYEGSACVSFVAFDFLDTRVLGVPWPGFRNFPEINLRFYVRRGERRGVAFVRELVPSELIAMIARVTYNEPYRAIPMVSKVTEQESYLDVHHQLFAGDRIHELSVRAENKPWLPAESSIEHFFKEHQWGYGRSRSDQLLEYEVRHPHWEIYPVDSWEVHADFGKIYGAQWSFLNGEEPLSVTLAEGSEIEVYPATSLS